MFSFLNSGAKWVNIFALFFSTLLFLLRYKKNRYFSFAIIEIFRFNMQYFFPVLNKDYSAYCEYTVERLYERKQFLFDDSFDNLLLNYKELCCLLITRHTTVLYIYIYILYLSLSLASNKNMSFQVILF